MIVAPTALVGPRVSLRPWRAGDEPALVDGWADPEVQRWTAVPEDASRRAAQLWIDGVASRSQAGVAIDLVITRPGVDEILGEVGLYGFDRRRRGAQVGYWLSESARGHGYAVAAVDLLAEWALEPERLAVVVARGHRDNTRSHSVALGAGFVAAGSDADGYELFVRRSPEHC